MNSAAESAGITAVSTGLVAFAPMAGVGGLFLDIFFNKSRLDRKTTNATKAATEINPGERSDVSWISTESPDRTREVVVAKGMNDAQFQGNPIVTLGHAYYLPPVGKSLWRKRVKDFWYQHRLLAELGGATVRGAAEEAHHLSDLLGEDHDLGLLRGELNGIAAPVDIDAFVKLVEHRQRELRDGAGRNGLHRARNV